MGPEILDVYAFYMAGIVKLALEVYQNSKSISESFLLLVYFVTISKASMALEPCANKTATWGIPEKSSEALTKFR